MQRSQMALAVIHFTSGRRINDRKLSAFSISAKEGNQSTSSEDEELDFGSPPILGGSDFTPLLGASGAGAAPAGQSRDDGGFSVSTSMAEPPPSTEAAQGVPPVEAAGATTVASSIEVSGELEATATGAGSEAMAGRGDTEGWAARASAAY